MKKRLRYIFGVLSAIVLVCSFPIRNMFGAFPCDVMRIVGFILLLMYLVVMKAEKKK